MNIPIVCGTTGQSQTIGLNGSCPVCRSEGSVILVDRYQRFCFCFLPLCKVGRDRIQGECQQCGSTLPASVVVNSAGYTHLFSQHENGHLSHQSRHEITGPRSSTVPPVSSPSINSEGEMTPLTQEGRNDQQRLIPWGVR